MKSARSQGVREITEVSMRGIVERIMLIRIIRFDK